MRKSVSSRTSNLLRIIGGRWRGRKINFPAVESIRPTPDRVRETVFNWLQKDIEGAHCLDLFAGSGALGIEALSRGAANVVFVERDAKIVKHLRDTLFALGSDRGEVVGADALQWLKHSDRSGNTPFDVVFLDPPFAAGTLPEIGRLLEAREWLANPALIYLECSSMDGAPQCPENWAILKSKTAGQVGYHLARRVPPQRNPLSET